MPQTGEFNPYEAPSQSVAQRTAIDFDRSKSILWIRAPLWRRVFAGVVDLAIAFACDVLGGLLFLGTAFATTSVLDLTSFQPLPGPLDQILTVALIAGFAICVYGPMFAYYIIMECSPLQATLGKYWLGLAVVRTNGQCICRKRSLFRTVVKLIGLMLYGIGLIWMFFNRNRQALHDRVTDTVVVLRDSIVVYFDVDE